MIKNRDVWAIEGEPSSLNYVKHNHDTGPRSRSLDFIWATGGIHNETRQRMTLHVQNTAMDSPHYDQHFRFSQDEAVLFPLVFSFCVEFFTWLAYHVRGGNKGSRANRCGSRACKWVNDQWLRLAAFNLLDGIIYITDTWGPFGIQRMMDMNRGGLWGGFP